MVSALLAGAIGAGLLVVVAVVVGRRASRSRPSSLGARQLRLGTARKGSNYQDALAVLGGLVRQGMPEVAQRAEGALPPEARARGTLAEVDLFQFKWEVVYGVVRRVIEGHAAVLLEKRRRFRVVDDYGKVSLVLWNEEKSYFLRHVVLADLVPLLDEVAHLQLVEAPEMLALLEDEFGRGSARDAETWMELIDVTLDDLGAVDFGGRRSATDHRRFEAHLMPREGFVALVARAMTRLGWEVDDVPLVAGGRCDFISGYKGLRVAVLCDNGGDRLSREALERAAAVLGAVDASLVAVISVSGFGPAALSFAEERGVHAVRAVEAGQHFQDLAAAVDKLGPAAVGRARGGRGRPGEGARSHPDGEIIDAQIINDRSGAERPLRLGYGGPRSGQG
jgi:hypothetical protein